MKDISRELHSFPSPFARAIMRDHYDGGTSMFSVTTLISPPQRTYLKTLGEEIRSPYGSFAAMLGTAMHHIIEQNIDEEAGEIAERRLYTTIDVSGNNISVSGQIDHWENRTLSDYKLTGGVQDKMKEPHFLQVQMNGLLAERNDIPVDFVSVIYVQKDWSHLRSTFDPTYPQTPFKVYVHTFDRDLAVRTFQTTTSDHWNAKQGNPRPCTPDEQWRKPTTYALMKPDAKRASKVCDTRGEAEQLLKPGQVIVERPGEATYCLHFCGFAHLCNQFKREQMSTTPES
jgi:hypothetical protein